MFFLFGAFTCLGQESFRKAFTLRGPMVMEGGQTVTLAKDTLIQRTSLMPSARSVNPVVGAQFLTLTRAVTIRSGSVSSDANAITIRAGSVLELHEMIVLRKEKAVKFARLTTREQDSLRRIYPLGEFLPYTIERVLPAGKALVVEKVRIDSAFLAERQVKKEVVADPLPARKGFVKFDEDKVWVNPNLVNFESDGLYYYQLKNRQTLKLHFTEVGVSALTLPLKYRLGSDDNPAKPISEEFTTAINLNLFLGWTLRGTTIFHYREKVGNISNTAKWTLGPLFGASTVTLNKSNTSAAENPITDDTEITKGLATVGIGGTYSFNKINAGLFYGWDFSIGADAARWNYNRRPWLGLALGYSLFPF